MRFIHMVLGWMCDMAAYVKVACVKLMSMLHECLRAAAFHRFTPIAGIMRNTFHSASRLLRR